MRRLQRTWIYAIPALLLGLVVFGDAAPSAAEAADPPPNTELQQIGRQDYLESCAVCHGVEGRGDGPSASALRIQPADLTKIAARREGKFPRLEIAYIIDGRFELTSHGTRDMPIWGKRFGESLPANETGDAFVRGRIAALVEYLVSIQTP